MLGGFLPDGDWINRLSKLPNWFLLGCCRRKRYVSMHKLLRRYVPDGNRRNELHQLHRGHVCQLRWGEY